MSDRLKKIFGFSSESDEEFDEDVVEPTTEEIEAAKVILSAVEPETEDAEEEFTIPEQYQTPEETFPDDTCFICRSVGLKGAHLNMLASSGHVVMFFCSNCMDRFKRG